MRSGGGTPRGRMGSGRVKVQSQAAAEAEDDTGRPLEQGENSHLREFALGLAEWTQHLKKRNYAFFKHFGVKTKKMYSGIL